MNHMEEKIDDQSMVLKKESKSQIEKAINNMFIGGKKAGAEKVIFKCMKALKKTAKHLPSNALAHAVDNACPFVQMKSKKVGGISYKIPVHIFESKRPALGVKWLISSSCGRKAGSRLSCLRIELLNAWENKGQTVQRKKSLHNLAILNRAYIKFL